MEKESIFIPGLYFGGIPSRSIDEPNKGFPTVKESLWSNKNGPVDHSICKIFDCLVGTDDLSVLSTLSRSQLIGVLNLIQERMTFISMDEVREIGQDVRNQLARALAFEQACHRFSPDNYLDECEDPAQREYIRFAIFADKIRKRLSQASSNDGACTPGGVDSSSSTTSSGSP